MMLTLNILQFSVEQQEETELVDNHDNPLMSWILQSVVSPLKGSQKQDAQMSAPQQNGGDLSEK
eukprot:747263-Hanusia_phi.AAC.1